MSDTYEATFTWPAGPNEVIITGTFDNWSKSTKLVRSWEGSFSTTLKFPCGSKILFKYIVDGQWVTSRHERTETDPNGNVNNVYQVPLKPEPTSTTFAPAARTAVETQTAPAPTPSGPKPEPVADPSKQSFVQTLTSVKDSALATEGVHPPTVTSYIASGVGGAIAAMTGVDPLNVPKVLVDEPQAKPTTETELDLSPAAEHGKSSAPPRDLGKLPSLFPAAADGKKATPTQPIGGFPSLFPAETERRVFSPTAPTAPANAPLKPAAATPTPTPPTTTKVPVAPEPTPAAKVPKPMKTVEETKPASHAPETSEAASTLREKPAHGADELGRNASSTAGSTLRSKKKRGSLFSKIKAVFHPEKEKETETAKK